MYLVIFSSYVLFTRVPDYFEGEFIKGVVSKATFLSKTNSPEVIIDYHVGSERLQYKTDTSFLTSYKPGQVVTIIYNPAKPAVSSIYAFIGYWINWRELLLTSAFFIILFIAARFITGINTTSNLHKVIEKKKRKYDD
ncbi:MAG: DUF3592 domain-containing protein [Bacteroidota bacterium]|nr:DUF3592 domain-containing protein [Bacteroidota bacterium]